MVRGARIVTASFDLAPELWQALYICYDGILIILMRVVAVVIVVTKMDAIIPMPPPVASLFLLFA